MRITHILAAGLLGLGASASWSAHNNTEDPSLHVEDSDLICHTSNLDECYPKNFVATDEFQVVHDDQAIPKGLHIRMNMQTGEKEAKLYDPTTDTDPGNAVEVLPDQPLRDETPGMHGNIQEQAQKVVEEMRKAKASKEESVKPPVGAAGDREIFDRNLKILQDYERLESGIDRDQAIDRVSAALEELEELCHDIYWGKELAKAMPNPLENLYQKKNVHDYTTRAQFNSLRSWLLAAALRNNAAALDSLDHWDENKDLVYDLPLDHLQWALKNVAEYQSDATVVSRSISLICALLPRDDFLLGFHKAGGLSTLHKAVLFNDRLARAEPATYPTKEGKRLMSRLKSLMEDYYLSDNAAIQMEAFTWLFEMSRNDAQYDDRGNMKESTPDLDTLCKEAEAGAEILRADYWEQYYPEVTRWEVPIWFKPRACNAWKRHMAAGDTPGVPRDEL